MGCLGNNQLSPTEQKVGQYINENAMLSAKDSILIGVSGGADSVCLLFVLLKIRECCYQDLHIEVAHIHHMIRNEEADGDMEYVETLCKLNGLAFHKIRKPIPEIAGQEGLTEEEAGRIVRYREFERICQENSLNKIAVAHHKDDQAETILMNLFRGTGIKGMAGIRPVRDRIIRPLLALSRTEIEQYLDDRHIAYRTDSTNFDNEYTRNKVRNELIDYIQKNINSKAVDHIAQLGSYAAQMDDYFEKKADSLFETCGNIEENRVILCLDSAPMEELELVYLLRKCIVMAQGGLKDIGHDYMTQLLSLVYGRTGAGCLLPNGILVEKSYQNLIFTNDTNIRSDRGEHAKQEQPIKSLHFLQDLHENQPVEIEFLGYWFTFTKINCEKNEKIPKKKYTKCFDYDTIEFALQLRTRKNGDYLRINAKGDKKKLKDYLIDEKVPRNERDRLVLLAGDEEVLWVVGMRDSGAYRIVEDTRHILMVECRQVTKDTNGGEHGR